MQELDDLMFSLGHEERLELARRQQKFLSGQKKVVTALGRKIDEKEDEVRELQDQVHRTYQPNGYGAFLEAEGFEGYHSLQFFYDLAKFLDTAFSPTLENLPRIQAAASQVSTGRGEDYGQNLVDLLSDGKAVVDVTHQAVKVLDKGVLPFEKVVRSIYHRAIDQFKYLQKRFLNIGGDDSRAYRNPWEDDDHRSGFDLNRVPYVKIDLVRDNALLTDLLLDVAEHLPREHTKKEKVKGKRKPRETKFLDQFDVDRTARVLVELSDPTYQGYLRDPHAYMQRLSRMVGDYHEIMVGLEPTLKEALQGLNGNPLANYQINTDVLRRTMPDPAPITARVTGINYNGVRPNEEDVRPSSNLEKRYFTARRRLLEHLADSMDSIGSATDYSDKLDIARAAVEKGIKLKERMRESLQTTQAKKLKRDQKSQNEFYVGTSGQHGEFTFEREAAPDVRLRDVVGASFDDMKQHLADLAEYSKYAHLYGATAPRGKIRSNIVAIGPYGCGKTEIGRAIAGDPRFIGAEVSVTDLLTCWFGEFEKNVDRVWDAARVLRRDSGDSKLVFLLMDEFDSWFSGSNGHWVDHTYQRVQKAIQMKLDGVVDYEGIITVGFTNEPKKVPLAIYRRFKYVDIVGELTAEERTGLMKQFITNGLPLSSGFRQQHYQQWGELLEGATGDVVGKITDDIHYEFMRKFIDEHPREGRNLNGQIRRMQARNGGELDKPYIKRAMGQYMKVTPDWVDAALRGKLAEPIIREQIDTAVRVYAEARDVLANLHKRQDVASGSVVGQPQGPEYRTRQGSQLV